MTMEQLQIIDDVKKASELWKNAFNAGIAGDCAGQYTSNAIMHARPFGTFTGTKEITGFWQKLIDDGFANVEYIQPEFNVIDEQSVIVNSQWKMNHASGVIHKELWVKQKDGKFKLTEDDFEVLESSAS